METDGDRGRSRETDGEQTLKSKSKRKKSCVQVCDGALKFGEVSRCGADEGVCVCAAGGAREAGAASPPQG
eukprot:2972128-Rhodomonas_salina.2